MSAETLKSFLLWSTIINFAFIILSSLAFACAKNFCVSIHQKFFKLSEEKMLSSVYKMIGIYKILVMVFNFVPYLVLLIIS